jgi:Transposase DDE domain
MDRIKSKSIGLLLPAFADEFVGGEAAESFESFGEVVGGDEVAEVGSQLVVSVIVVALNCGLFDGAVHPLHLTVVPGMIRFGEPVVDAVQKTGPVKRMAAKAGCWSLSILWKISELDAIVGEHGVNPIRNSRDQRLQEAIEAQQNKLGRVPRLVTADADFYSQAQERGAKQRGVQWVAVPNRQTRSAERKKLEKAPWFKKAQAWRTGCEGRISVLKRRHGLSRCRYPGMEGMKRWVGNGCAGGQRNQPGQGPGGSPHSRPSESTLSALRKQRAKTIASSPRKAKSSQIQPFCDGK